ncbi:HYR domain-containing protein [Flavobacterium polysaccharolyticum]|uniref:HYR domain-containing protein n=1 Tax=Flavobacterium polysaccharolyticum TaxID=3133148 RepID=A0ABU9NRM9_9FLAO
MDCSFVVNASADVTKPTITCPSNQSLSCGSVLPDYRSLVIANDDCTASPTITQSPVAGSAFTSGMTVTMRATDASGNFVDCSFVVNASADVTKPTITCPPNQSLSCGSVLPDYRSLVTATDDCTASPTITQSPAVGSFFTSGMTVTMRATDASGNFVDCSFVVNASADVTKPTITCPSNQSLSCGSVLPDYRSLVTATDNCTASPTITQTPAVGSVFTSGMTVTMTATDASGNFVDCSFVVNASADVTKPTITCPSNQSLSCGSVLPDYRSLVTATDDCTASPTITQTPASGSAFTSGMTVTMRATDASGNFVDCSFVVNASADVTKPIISCPTNQSLVIGSALPDYRSLATASDNCATSLTITQNPAPGSIFASNGLTVTIEATDTSGNFASCSFIVNNSGSDLPPVIGCPSGEELFANSTLPNYVFSLTSISDDITDTVDLVFTQTPPQGTIFTADTNVTITAKDESGNVNSCTFLVKLKTTNVVLDCKSNSSYYLNLDGKYGFTIYGEKADGNTGFSVSTAGDINGDGISDFLIGAPGNYDLSYGKNNVLKFIEGSAYLVFGNASGFPPNIDLALLNGTNGFKIRNDTPFTNEPNTGYDVSSAGDINGDGITDFMVSDPYRVTSSVSKNGNTYVVFGRTSGYPAELVLSSLNGTNGFSLIGAIHYEGAGSSIASVEDVNGDGTDDIAILAGNSSAGNGICYVLYGKTSGFPAQIKTDQINGTNGFVIEGDASVGKVGSRVVGLGDINGDGFPDIGLGSYNGSDQHRKYVVYGRSTNFPATINTASLNGSNGFILENTASPLDGYFSVSRLGDINGDGINDLVVHESYVLFGSATIPAVMDLKNLNGINGFKLLVAGNTTSIGDFNKDGIGDFGFISSQTFYAIYGKSDWTTTTIDYTFLNNLKPSQGLKIGLKYYRNYDLAFAGDVNKDGVDDVIIGNSNDVYNIDVNHDPGYAYVIYGKKITDTEKPVITNCPSDKILTKFDPIPDYKSTITVTDNCDTSPIVTQSPVAGTVFNGVSQEVILTVTDASGNKATCSFNIDSSGPDLPPAIVCPATQELYANSMLPNYVHFLQAVSDDIAKQWELVFTQTPVAGTLFTADTNVTITVEDKSGNTSSCTFLVKLKTGGFDIDCKTTTINVNELNGSNGFTLYGETVATRAGFSTTPVGDINGDGMSDFAIGAPGDSRSEGCYVVFGTKTGFPASINLANLDGQNGFQITNDYTAGPSRTGFDVSDAGDINGDGVSDLIVSASERETGSISGAGRVFVIYGKTTGFSASIPVSSIDGTNGFSILGQTSYEILGFGVAGIGDFNNDSHSDIAIATLNKGSGNVRKTYILFGKSSNFPATVNIGSLDSSNSCIIEGDVRANLAGVGDVNGDGISDVAVSGEDKFRYVIYGSASLPATINTNSLNGSNGFKIENSVSPLETSYYFEIRSAGDLNGDSLNDIGMNNYVLFGKSTTPAVVDLKDLDGTNGFKMNGSTFEYLHTYSSFGDFNQDGFDDYLLPYNNATIYLIYGKANWNPLLDIFSLNASQGLKISTRYSPKYSASFIGDVNGDTVDDIIIGSTKTVYNSNPNEDPGMSYVVFGKKTVDTEKPTITNCPANQVLAVNDPIPDYTKIVTVTDNCDNKPIITQSPVAGTLFDGVSQEVTLTATDASGNIATCKFNISTVADTQKPVITCVGNQTLACGTATIPNYISLINATDNIDPNPVITQSPVAGSPFVNGMTITMTATDASNNVSTCSFIVNASADVTKPTMSCLGTQFASCEYILPDFRSLVTASDNCDANPVITQSPVPGSAYGSAVTVTLRATDASGNFTTCNFAVIQGVDNIKPVITCVGNQTLASGTATIPDYKSLITTTDNCDPSPKVTQNPIAGSPFVNGMTITMTATDVSSNFETCSFIINASVVADTEKPIITCVGNQNVACGTATIPNYINLITATDNIDANPVITQSPVAGSPFVNGMTITMTATDASANFETCSFLVNVSADIIKPIVTCAGNQTLASGTATIPDYKSLITATDNCDPSPKVTQNPIAGSPFVNGMTITMTATDVSSNFETCSFIINASVVADTEKPIITCVGNQTLACGTATIPNYINLITATDNIDANPVITQSPVAGSPFVNGMTITMTATDASGNFETCSFLVNVSADIIKPIITCAGNQTLASGTATIPDYKSLVTATDNCDPSPKVTQNPVAGSPFVSGMTITMTATDVSSNFETCSFIINASVVADTQKPVITCVGNQTLTCGTATIPDYTSLITATDNVDTNPAITQNPVAGSPFVDGMTITMTARDISGNSSSCNFKVQQLPVSVSAGSDIYIIEGQTALLNATSSGNGYFSWTPSKGLSNTTIANPVARPLETTTYTVVYTDMGGCSATDSVTIYVDPEQNDDTKYGLSANDDGINDFWKIDTIEEYPNNEVYIYNRWGDLVFQIKNYNNTTNVFSGIANRKRDMGADILPEGTYFFEIKIEGTHHLKKTKGFLVLKR